MKEREITEKAVLRYLECLEKEEKSRNTIEKYKRDIYAFKAFASGKRLAKDTVIEYKNYLPEKGYSIRSINSMLSALNSFFVFSEWGDMKIKLIKLQREIYCPEEKELTREEYVRLVKTAEDRGKDRLSLIIQTVCATGIRISELAFITVEAVNKGKAVVTLKGKSRTVFIVSSLQKKLLSYAIKNSIKTGAVFVTRSGNPVSRTNVWREMKELCEKADISPEKVFPHNLRHLFARTFYEHEKDIVKLADVLGHSSIDTTRIYTATTGKEHLLCLENMHLTV